MKSYRTMLFSLLSLTWLTAFSSAPSSRRPRLVVGVVVDQMRWDYLQRYRDTWSGGFRRLLSGGYSFDNTYLCYVPTVTAAGHASIFTGTTPAIHGMAGNDFFIGGRKVYCTSDTTVRTVGSSTSAGEMSPRNLLCTTLGDELKLSCPGSRVVGVSLKDRASILPAGHSADAAYWYDRGAGCFVTSTYYMERLPAWVDAFNASHSGLGDVRYTPRGITLTADMALAALEHEALGQRGATDMLTVSFSSTDYIGHKYGTMAPETDAVYMELDRQLERLFAACDSMVGRGEWIVFLTADHAAAHNDIEMQRRGMPAGTWRVETVLENANAMLRQRFATEENLVKCIIDYRIYLDRDAIARQALEPGEVKAALTDFLQQDERVMAAIDYERLYAVTLPEAVRRRIELGYCHKRSGDIIVVMQPGFYAFDADSFEHGTTHGVWNPYDSHIPLLFYGWHVPAGSTPDEASVVDIVVTLSAMLGIQQPNGSIGKVLKMR